PRRDKNFTTSNREYDRAPIRICVIVCGPETPCIIEY
ncbi:MAG: hypothetical protein ACI84D_003731, partial [Thalassolituus oleivorans]